MDERHRATGRRTERWILLFALIGAVVGGLIGWFVPPARYQARGGLRIQEPDAQEVRRIVRDMISELRARPGTERAMATEAWGAASGTTRPEFFEAAREVRADAGLGRIEVTFRADDPDVAVAGAAALLDAGQTLGWEEHAASVQARVEAHVANLRAQLSRIDQDVREDLAEAGGVETLLASYRTLLEAHAAAPPGSEARATVEAEVREKVDLLRRVDDMQARHDEAIRLSQRLQASWRAWRDDAPRVVVGVSPAPPRVPLPRRAFAPVFARSGAVLGLFLGALVGWLAGRRRRGA